MKKIFLSLVLICCSHILQAKPIELIFWHAMAGHLGDEVRALSDAFNRSQNEYTVIPVYKGNYVETITSFAAAFRAHQAPAMVQIFEVGTAIMLSPQGVIKPVDSLMKEQGISLPKEDFIQSVVSFYSRDGVLMAMPFNLSVPTLYYNKTVLAKLGYSETNFPKTWAEMEHMAKRIKEAGYDCAYTTAYPGWVLFESFLAIHGLPLTQMNPIRSAFATPQLLRHFKRLKRWNDLHYFRYAGRVDDATILFTSKVCPLLSQSSGAYNSLSDLVNFPLGIAAMPLDTDISSIRHANVAGGAAIWAVAGQSTEKYKGIAHFFAFLAKPETQKRWHEHTGYIPIGLKGIYTSITQESQQPTLFLALSDLEEGTNKKPYILMGPQNQIRGANDEELEAMFAGLKTPEEALEAARLRSDHILQRFIQNTSKRT